MNGDGKTVAHAPPDHWWERIGGIETVLAAFCAATEEKLGFLMDWKRDQNGELKDIRDLFSQFRGSFNKWLIGILGTLLVALIIFLFNMFGDQAVSSDAITDAMETMTETLETTLNEQLPLMVEQAVHAAINGEEK